MKKLAIIALILVLFSLARPSYGATCTAQRDFFCPDSSCITIDPDCCDAANRCQPGLYCDTRSNTCLTRSGQTCATQADCLGDTYCSVDAGLCVSNKFVFINPPTLRAQLGTRPVFTVTLFDPANRTGTYKASVTGTGRYFARFFGTETALSFTLKPNEVKTIPLYFSAGAIGNYQLKIQVVDSTYGSTSLAAGYPGGIAGWSDVTAVEVVAETKAPTFVSASGPPAPLMVGVLGALAFFFLLL